jgi:C1A family cysteine protease
MKKRGAGWIPDYPDQSDYTLENVDQKLSSKVQTQGSTTSIQILADKMSKILDTLVGQADMLKLKKEDLTALKDNIENEIFGGVRFITVDLHDVFKVGNVDPEVLVSINNYVQLIVLTWSIDRKMLPYETDTTLSKKTLGIIQKILKNQDLIQYEQFVDPDNWICLETLATLAKVIVLLSSFTYVEKLKKDFQEWIRMISDPKRSESVPMQSTTDFPTKHINLFFEICQYLSDSNPTFKVNTLTPTEELQTQLIAFVYRLYKDVNDTITSMLLDFSKLIPVMMAISYLDVSTDEKIPTTNLTYIEYFVEFLQKFKKYITDLQKKLQSFVESVNSIKINDDEEWDKLKDCVIKTVEKLKNKLIKYLEGEDNLLIQTASDENIANRIKIYFELSSEMINCNTEFLVVLSAVWKWKLPKLPSRIFSRNTKQLKSPINDILFKLVSELQTQFFTVDDSKADVDDSKSEAIAEIVAQMLMPLGQHINLSDAVCKVLKKMQYLVKEDNEMSLGNKRLIQEILEQQVTSLRKDNAPSLLDDSILKKITLSVIQTKSENSLLEDKGKQTLFKVLSKEEHSEKYRQVQFPIRQKFINENPEIKDKISNIESASSKLTQVEIFKETSEKKSDVYLRLPTFVDLSYWCSPVEDQGGLNSCTAHAGIALIEYAQRKSSNTYVDASPLFLYKVTRNLMQKEGDSGASMRDTMKAMVAFGVCPEEHWSYDEADFELEPPAFCYSFAENFKALKYFRLDHGTISKSTLLAQVKVLLASEIPCSFGFTLYSSVYEESNFDLGHIPLPTSRDKVVGGHVVVAVGYHDRKIIKNSNGDQFEGALLIRNSWGSRWGQGGYGWMPYEYVIKGLTADWWSLLKAEWLASGSFGAGASALGRDMGDRGGNIGDE